MSKDKITNQPPISTVAAKPSTETVNTSRDQIDYSAKEITSNTQKALSELKGSLVAPTIKARSGKDRPSTQHVTMLERIEKKMKSFEAEFNQQLIDLNKNASSISYKEIIEKSNKIIEAHKEKVFSYGQAITYAVLALAGPNNKIEPEDYARFDMLIDNVTQLHEKNVNITEVIGHIRQRAMTKQDVQYVCRMLKKHEYKEQINTDRDKIGGSASALFVSIMNPYQRYKVLQEYAKIYSPDEAKKLIDTFTETSIITIKQREQLFSEINKSPYQTSQDEEKKFFQAREINEKLYAGIREKMNSPMAINGAERILNRRSLLAGAITAIGAMGMITNYMIHFNSSDKWSEKLTAGLTKPHFWIGAAAAAGGVHYLGKGMTPGESVGFFDKIVPSPKPAGNPFGYGDKAGLQNEKMNELAEISSNHSLIEKWVVNGGGFESLDKFVNIKKRKEIIDKNALKIKGKSEKNKDMPKMSDFAQLETWLKNNDREGYLVLMSSKQRYGVVKTKSIFDRLIGIHDVLGITSKQRFETKGIVTYGQNYSYKDILRDKQGLTPLIIAENVRKGSEPKKIKSN
ncbi:hypothetical protein KKD70_04290 [Patescibacteria group bacterium]|nr:hypothetical protein [Patescibacteria group bacterium]